MTNRRDFILKSSIAAATTVLGLDIVFGKNLPKGLDPIILDQEDFYAKFGKHKDLLILNDKPWNVEAQAHILDDAITPASKMYVRNNGLIPEKINADLWQLTIDGESAVAPKTYSLQDLKKFPKYTYRLTLECGGNGRNEFDPPAKGNQWTVGAVSCAEWTGVRLKDLLADVGLKKDAVYIGYYGADTHISGDTKKNPISRGVPISKAMMEETLVAYAMNGKDIPIAHGFPLRLVAGGWPASASGKWINRLVIRNRIHDGEKMGGQSYRMPRETVAPGERVADENMVIIESMPVKSLVTYPKTGAIIGLSDVLEIRGHAWAGEHEVTKMDYSIDFGATWKKCTLEKPYNRLAWQRWRAKVTFPKKGYFEVWARATDDQGIMQPMILPGWNPNGYLNNACHRIAIKVS